MIELTTEAWTLALAACASLLLSSTTLALAVQSSAARSRGGVCILLLSSLALGFGLWSTNFVQVLSVQIPGTIEFGLLLAGPYLCHRGKRLRLRAFVPRVPRTGHRRNNRQRIRLGRWGSRRLIARLSMNCRARLVTREGLLWVWRLVLARLRRLPRGAVGLAQAAA